jgi:DNA-directed RNA polymerase specialized sigma24 family protein
MRSLPDRLREACLLHYFEGLAVKEVSQKLNASLDAVLKRLERARKSLRGCIERKLSLGGRTSTP